jgi:hypothetical protein
MEHYVSQLNPASQSLFGLYSSGKDRMTSYREMVERMLNPAREGKSVCGVFYGHPGVFVFPSHEAIWQARQEGVPAKMLPAVSAEDCLFADLGFGPAIPGCQSLADWRHRTYDLGETP